MPLDEHHPFGWRIGGARSRPKSWRRANRRRPPKLDEIIIGVCRNCHMTLDIMLRWLTSLQAGTPMTPGLGYVSIYAGRLALAITARSRGGVELQQFLETTRNIKLSRKDRP